MSFGSLVEVAELEPHLHDPSWALVDCRFTLGDPERGERDYLSAHVPGAVYAHLDRDLSAAVEPGRTGRHPLPAIADLAERLGGWGIDQTVQVIAYDDMGGAFAARLWWLLRWLGHDAVAVLDGGWPAWLAAGGARRAGPERRPPRVFRPRPRPELVVDAATVAAMAADPSCRVLDARGADRYRGENETIDPVAGHIPGAISAPFADNLDAEGRFLSPEALRARYRALLDGAPAERSAAYCGSGVTGAHDLLAMARAGIEGGRLYAGSWSEWITDPSRPVATGTDPAAAPERRSAAPS
ncbi:MAG: sulfurtransferase [Chloroflexi bacterium]|nr:sulfurtransferase [Chloroflexota bacterium]